MNRSLSWLATRPVVWALASMSFACLLGQFYNLWSMRFFACSVLPIATALLAYVAYATRQQPDRGEEAYTWIVEGALGGLFAAVVYDLFRLPFVLHGYPLFGVFPKFGQMLLGAAPTDMGVAVQVTGWLYHFSNGMALGIMFLAMVLHPTPRNLIWGGALWAVGVETMLLLTPYYSFFHLKLDWNTFIALTLSAHLIFGVALGLWCRRRLPALNPTIARG
ncbi:MAG: hypothetical protein JO316_18180 [Abitibacteriaceae bacterium]|nr:hypothetical protein [Abditibacteriaceae bacterium]